MTPAQKSRRERIQAAKEADLTREARYQEKRGVAIWLRTAPQCHNWYNLATDWGDFELAPTAHQILQASVVSDESVLEYMKANVSNLRFFDWYNGTRQDIRRAFPHGSTAEQIVVKLWHMERRNLIGANLDAGRFGLGDGGAQ